jgi:CAAX prenyl protease-like protein
VPFVLPFAVLLALLAAGNALPFGPEVTYPVRTLAVAAALLVFSRGAMTLRASRPWASIALGVAVFAAWVAPDLLWPGYRNSVLFQNSLTGTLGGAPPPQLQGNALFLLVRAGGSALVVPFAEELFWRGWLMRRLMAADFREVPLGAYSAQAFWITALLFASEHGPFWDVGLAAGVAYNWWIVRTRNLADCVLAHAVTNACLGAYVVLAGAWRYWL